MASKTYNVGVVGYGFSAKIFHIPFVKEVPELKLYAVVQRTPKADDDAEKDHPGVKSFRTTEEMVQDSAIDVVIITTAPDSHFALSKLALEAGKHGEFIQGPRLDQLETNMQQSSARSPSPPPPKKPTSSSRSLRRTTSSSPCSRVCS